MRLDFILCSYPCTFYIGFWIVAFDGSKVYNHKNIFILRLHLQVTSQNTYLDQVMEKLKTDTGNVY